MVDGKSSPVNADELVEETTTVVSLPEVYLRVKQAIDDPDAGLCDIASILSRDPGMTARLLRVANSAFFGLAARVDNVTQAVNLLGPKMVHDLVLATSVTRAFDGLCDSVINMDVFWQNSIYRAVLCKLLAVEGGVVGNDRFFVIGLLTDIGHLPMYHAVPNTCQAALDKSLADGSPLFAAERELVGFDYAEVGGKLLRAWGLPESICQPVLFQVDPARSEGYLRDAAIARIVDEIVNSAAPDVALAEREIDIAAENWQLAQVSELQYQQGRRVSDDVGQGIPLVQDQPACRQVPIMHLGQVGDRGTVDDFQRPERGGLSPLRGAVGFSCRAAFSVPPPRAARGNPASGRRRFPRVRRGNPSCTARCRGCRRRTA